ncbi:MULTISPECIES: caspase family protein [unclassified Bradyrhizobium]|uniref:caspase family protein n=1 Tax=unclassified Bradyrhizobium TaxID=2631580 RepID=UPI002916DD7D|nr:MULTISPECIES: caspase family protein [unclassified Bradyrhizobium]
MRFFSIAFGLLLLLTTESSARNWALLIGVSGYPYISQLQGPRNDVTIMWRLLKTKGFQPNDIVVLADGLPHSDAFPEVTARPTRAAIVDAVTDLTKRVRAKDFVYVHISSHGSEQPKSANDPTPQPFDRNQVMLPFDVRPSTTDAMTISNGLLDEDLGRLLDMLRAKGANVFVAIDMCHAGTAARGNLVARYVAPADLGIRFPAGPRDGPARLNQARSDILHAMNGGSLTAFFAVNSTQLSYEKSFLGYAPPLVGPEQTLGVFTFLLHRALSQFHGYTYRDLANDIIRELDSGVAGHGLPLPVFEGNIDDVLFAGGNAAAREGWPARYDGNSIWVSAGRLHGLVEGSTVALVKNSRDDESVVAEATIIAANAAESRASLRSGQKPPDGPAFWARLVERAVSLSYRISEPPADDVRKPGGDTAMAAVQALKQQRLEDQRIAIEWLPAGASEADFRLWVTEQRMWITGTTGELHTDNSQPNASPSIALFDTKDAAKQLLGQIWQLARAQDLVRVARNTTTNSGLVVASLERFRMAEQGPANGQDCPDTAFYQSLLDKPAGRLKPVGDEVVSVSHCDLVAIKLRSTSAKFVDAAVLYVDARGGILMINPTGDASDCGIALPPGSSDPTVAATRIVVWNGGHPVTVGIEHIVVVAIERPTGTVPMCYAALTQPTLTAARTKVGQAAGRGSQTSLRRLLEAISVADANTRAAVPPPATERDASFTHVFTLDVRQSGRP